MKLLINVKIMEIMIVWESVKIVDKVVIFGVYSVYIVFFFGSWRFISFF